MGETGRQAGRGRMDGRTLEFTPSPTPVPHDPSTGPLCAGNDVWRLEPVKLEWAGLPLQHGVQLRVRHVPSGRYLTADGAKAVAAAESLRAAKLVSWNCVGAHSVGAIVDPSRQAGEFTPSE